MNHGELSNSDSATRSGKFILCDLDPIHLKCANNCDPREPNGTNLVCSLNDSIASILPLFGLPFSL